MHMNQLRAFSVIAREKNLTRAAEILHLSQSAISSQLKGLEEQLGVSLFARSTRGMLLTEAGKILLEHAEQVLAAISEMQRRAETLSRGITATVTIGLNTDPTFLRISAINQRLSLLHPDLSIVFHASETISTAQRLRGGMIDLGFFYGTISDDDIAQRLITHVRVCVAIPTKLIDPAVPLDWGVVSELPWIWVDDKFPFYQVLSSKLGAAIKPPKNVVTAANEQIVRELVIAGQGVALMREDEARPLEQEGRVVLWESGWSDIPLKLGWLKENDATRHLQKARDAICYAWEPDKQEYGDSLSDKAWI
ncbi:MAG: LysR family transcriptional regulator [Desulfuromonas sp.]|nr:MAG: LysR family transcriptional regulator [Desulfuromonas sp.]